MDRRPTSVGRTEYEPFAGAVQSVAGLYDLQHDHADDCLFAHPETGELTNISHLIPRSRGGLTSWHNVVTACAPCNLLKGGRLAKDADMFPKVHPFEPTVADLQRAGQRFPPNHLHESWRDFLYWDTPLEP